VPHAATRLTVLFCLAIAQGAAAFVPPAAAAEPELPVSANVPYVPTPWPVVAAMLELARVGKTDFVVDLGSGDGRIVIEAARVHGARGFGVDIDPDLVRLSNGEARRLGVHGRVEFFQRDLFETDFSRATVLTMYLLPKVVQALRPRLFSELRPGARIVSHDFGMDDWQPDDVVKIPVADRGFGPPFSTVYLWIVPAFVHGTWRGVLRDGQRDQPWELELSQHFQRIQGVLRVGGRSVRLDRAELRGDRIAFSAQPEVAGRRVRHDFSGRVGGGEIAGEFVIAGAAGPIAARAQRAAFAAPALR
jgi:hypothetical protein